jgi:hypothetical protein
LAINAGLWQSLSGANFISYTDKSIAKVLENINFLRNKRKVDILLIFVTPFQLAALIGHL